jgi:hypothetical protein
MILRVLGFTYFAAGCLYAWRHSATLSLHRVWGHTVKSLRTQGLPWVFAPALLLGSLAIDIALWPWDWWRERKVMKRLAAMEASMLAAAPYRTQGPKPTAATCRTCGALPGERCDAGLHG